MQTSLLLPMTGTVACESSEVSKASDTPDHDWSQDRFPFPNVLHSAGFFVKGTKIHQKLLDTCDCYAWDSRGAIEACNFSLQMNTNFLRRSHVHLDLSVANVDNVKMLCISRIFQWLVLCSPYAARPLACVHFFLRTFAIMRRTGFMSLLCADL